MAQLKDTTIKGNLNLEGNIFGNAEGNFESVPVRSDGKIPTISFGNVSSIYGRIGMNKADGRLIRYKADGTGYSVFDKEDVIPISNGGTGINYLGKNNQVLMSNGSSAYWNSINSLKPDCAKYADCAGRIVVKTASVSSLIYTSNIFAGYERSRDDCCQRAILCSFSVYSRASFLLANSCPYIGCFVVKTCNMSFNECVSHATSVICLTSGGLYKPGLICTIGTHYGAWTRSLWSSIHVSCSNNLIHGNFDFIEPF